MDDLADRVAALGRRSVARNAERQAEIEAANAANAARAEQVEQKRAELRESMPEIADVVDRFRAVFGQGVRVIAAREGGRSVVNRRLCERLGVEVSEYEQG